MPINLLDDSLQVDVYFDECDCDFEDNICISFWEDCPEAEQLFREEQTHICITAEQALQLAETLRLAVEKSQGMKRKFIVP